MQGREKRLVVVVAVGQYSLSGSNNKQASKQGEEEGESIKQHHIYEEWSGGLFPVETSSMAQRPSGGTVPGRG